MGTAKSAWEEFVVADPNGWGVRDFTLRRRVEGRGKNAVDAWQRLQSTTVYLDDSLERVLVLLTNAAEGLIEPYVSHDRIAGTYGDDDTFEVNVTGWVADVTPEQIATALKSKTDAEAQRVELDRQRAERDIARLRETHPDLFE